MKSKDQQELYIYEVQRDRYLYFGPQQLFELVDSLILTINTQFTEPYFTANEVLAENGGLIKEKYTNSLSLIEHAFNFICDHDEKTNKYSLNK